MKTCVKKGGIYFLGTRERNRRPATIQSSNAEIDIELSNEKGSVFPGSPSKPCHDISEKTPAFPRPCAGSHIEYTERFLTQVEKKRSIYYDGTSGAAGTQKGDSLRGRVAHQTTALTTIMFNTPVQVDLSAIMIDHEPRLRSTHSFGLHTACM